MALNAKEAILACGQQDQTYHIGAITHFQIGTHGNFWDNTIKRYARRILATGGGGGGYIRANDMLDPRTLVDPRYGVEPAILRSRECMAVNYTAGPSAGSLNRILTYWGHGGMPNGFSVVNTHAMPFVGFYANHEITSAGVLLQANVWRCLVVNDALGVLQDFATAITPTGPHELEIVFDGTNNTIYWYIDGVLQKSYAPASNAAPGQQTPYPVVGTAAGSWNMLWMHANVGNTTSQMLYHLSAGTPLVTIQYSDIP